MVEKIVRFIFYRSLSSGLSAFDGRKRTTNEKDERGQLGLTEVRCFWGLHGAGFRVQ